MAQPPNGTKRDDGYPSPQEKNPRKTDWKNKLVLK